MSDEHERHRRLFLERRMGLEKSELLVIRHAEDDPTCPVELEWALPDGAFIGRIGPETARDVIEMLQTALALYEAKKRR